MKEYKTSGDTRKTIVYFFVGLFAAYAADTAMYYQAWVFMVLMVVVLAICCVMIVKDLKRRDRHAYENYLRLRNAINVVSKQSEHDEPIDINIDVLKPQKTNVRPGSRPSAEYKKMVGDTVDDRGENQADSAG